ncbi:MAG: hypothetical protein K6G69_03205 [Lachnospiraceae bacterium]|nr:hypothetical protein [Lachnospiraceae bacterium]
MTKKNISELAEFVIWGTGSKSSVFSKGLVHKPSFYIDSDITKKDKFFFERRICHPSDIENWDELYIIIANSYYDDIKKELIERGLFEGQHFDYYENIKNDLLNVERLIDELKESMHYFKDGYSDFCNQILIFGSMISFDKNSCSNLNRTNQILNEKTRFLLISETYDVVEKDRLGLVEFPYFCLPLMLWQNYYFIKENHESIQVSEDIERYLSDEEYRINAVKDFEGKNKDIAEGYARIFVYYADGFLRELIDFINPRSVCIWNQFYPFHILIRYICKEKNIDLVYLEYGGIPGTYLIERTGQMGESYPATHWKEFRELPIDQKDLDKTKKVLDYLKTTGLNRRKQPENDELENARRMINLQWPTIVYFGQNDYESGMYPYNENAKRFHSPIFSSSNEAAFYLAAIAERNSWNFIYKPHPLCLGPDSEEAKKNLPKTAIVIDRCSINDLVDLADISVTILSTSAYISLIREKPVLMLGFTQLYKKESTYEALELEQIEETIKVALVNGYTKEQKDAFINQIAREIKYYVFDDFSERYLRYGRDWRIKEIFDVDI